MQNDTLLGHYSQAFASRRISTRIPVKGIVALTGSGKPVVARIHDIGAGGLSCLHADGAAFSDVEMDVLLFDVRTDEEFLLPRINGRIVARELVADPRRTAPVWRYNVEFQDLHDGQRLTLKQCPGIALDRLLGDRQGELRTSSDGSQSQKEYLGGRRAVALGMAR